MSTTRRSPRLARVAWAPALWLGLASPLLVGFGPGQVIDTQKQKDEMIAKLSSDINKVDHSIDVTKDLVKRSPDAPYLADLYFRLAELYVEKSRYTFARIMEMQPEGERSLSGEQSLEVQLTKKLAIETYNKILGDFPEYENNDQIRFFKAHEFRELGDFETMLKEYKELIEKYPKSLWGIEARLIIGDYHFDKGELPAAEEQYKQIIALPESHLHDMARYKLGWIRINEEKFKDALAYFEAAMTSSRKDRRGAIGDQKKLDVKRESLTAMVWPFSEVRKAKEALEYFRGLADTKTLYIAALKRLANRYFIKTDYLASALLYREIVRLSANIEENIEYVQRVYDSVRNLPATDPQKYAFAPQDVEGIVKTLARFQNHLKFSDEDKSKLYGDFELRARDLSTRLHVQSQAKKDVESAKIAADAYRRYLSLFTDSPELKTMRINRAEALHQSGKFLAAGHQYEEVAKDLEDSDERRDMLYSSIQSYFEAIDEDSRYRTKNPTKPGLMNKLQLLRAREGLKQLGAYYVKVWPQTDKTPQVKFNIARMFYQQGEYERASELFKVFVDEYPNHKDAPTAGNLAMDSLNKLDRYEDMAKLGAELAGNPKISDAKFKSDMARIGDMARKRKVEFAVLEASGGDFSEKMLGEWEKHKGTAEGEEFLYTAFVKYKGEGNIAGVFDFGGRIIGAYPESQKLVDVVGTMGNFAARGADFDRAAFLFEEFQKRFPNDKSANELLMSAANIRFALGDSEKAANAFRQLRTTGSAQQQLEANQRLMDIYRDARDWAQLAMVAQTALQGSRNWAGAAYHLGLAYARDGKDQLAAKELQGATRMRSQSEWDQTSAGDAAYELGRLVQKQYDDVRFGGGLSDEQALQQKLAMMQQVEGVYGNAIGSGAGPSVIAAAHALARVYKAFGDFLMSAPVPQGVSAAEYQAALKPQADQYYERGKQTMTVCGQKAAELKVFSMAAAACMRGSYDAPVDDAKRARAAVGGDDAYQKDMAAIRAELVNKPSSVELLEKLARRAMQVGDFHVAKLTLSKAVEVDPRSARLQNLLGVTLWQLGEVQPAYQALDRGVKNRSAEATLNLAALYSEYGYDREAKAFLGRAGNLAGLDLSAVDYHPGVRKMLTELGGAQ